MGCLQTLNLNLAAGDNAMDAAVNASGAGVIIGIRGNRLFQCNASTGAVQLQADIGTFGRNGCLAYDVGSNKVFAAVWNTPLYSLVGGFSASVRNLYRINPTTLAVELTADFATSFGISQAQDMTCQETGICAMDVNAGKVYCRWWRGKYIGNNGLGGGALWFSAANIATFATDGGTTTGGYPSIVYATIGGHDCALWPDQQGGPEFWIFDFTDGSLTTTHNVTNPKNPLALGFAPVQQHVIITDVAQQIYVYTTAGALVTTINTGRAAFNGLQVRFDSTDGNIYIPGGSDNSMCIVNPATNAFTITTGFDAPIDYVRAGATRFAVQAGGTPLKAF